MCFREDSIVIIFIYSIRVIFLPITGNLYYQFPSVDNCSDISSNFILIYWTAVGKKSKRTII